MNCHDFHSAWNELLDARDTAADRGLEGRLRDALAHSRGCARCRRAQTGYGALRQALASWSAGPISPPADLADRVLAALSSRAVPPAGVARPAPWRAIGLAGAAAAAAGIVLAIAPGFDRDGPGPKAAPPVPSSRRPEARGLDDSLAEATAATWDLARCASEPAARLGRGVLGIVVRAGSPPEAGPPVTLRSVFRGPIGSPPASSLVQGLGERVSAGVRPLSSTARRAFSFLLAPTPEAGGSRGNQTTSKGA